MSADRLRDLTDTSGGTCDWGGCDVESVAERYANDLGLWLPVCAQHLGKERRTSPGRGNCSSCGKEYTLSVDGVVRAHDRGWDRCAGSWRLPAPTKEVAP